MSRKPVLLLCLIAAFGLAQPALASGGQPLTRDQVRAEVLQAQAPGQLPAGGETGVWTAPATGTPLSRAQVLRELAASVPPPSGEVGDIGGIGQFAADHRDRSRAEVRAQAVQAMRAGGLPGGEL